MNRSAYRAFDADVAVDILVDRLETNKYFNAWGLPHLYWEDGARAVIEQGNAAVEPLCALLDDEHRAPVYGSEEASEENFLRLVLHNEVNAALLDRLPRLGLTDWYLVAGCLFQSVWNGLTDRPATQGIDDYDVFYFDDRDTSRDAEDVVINVCAQACSDLGVEVQVRNQARVHLWYPAKHGVPYAPLTSSRDGIDSFPNTSSCFGVQKRDDGAFEVYAPFGYEDVFDMVVRPNRRRFLPRVYMEKASRWQNILPSLTVLPWEEGRTTDGGRSYVVDSSTQTTPSGTDT